MRKNVLLTGSTGILGSRTLMELLREPETHVYCPVRASATLSPHERVVAALRVYSDHVDADIQSRIHATTCDLTVDSIEDVFNGLVPPTQLNRIIHCSALTSFISSHAELETANQNVTRKMVDYVNKYEIDETTFVSSYSIFGGNLFRKGYIQPSDLDVGQDFNSLRYAESKFKTEVLLRANINPRLKTAIVRPGNLHPDSETGRHPALGARGDDFFFDMLNFFFVSPKVPVGAGFRYDVTPVDLVAAAIAQLKPTGSCETYHLVTPHPPSLDEIYNAVKELRSDIVGVPAKTFFTETFRELERTYKPLRVLSLWSRACNIYFDESATFESFFDLQQWPSNEVLIKRYYTAWQKKFAERKHNHEVVGLGI